MKILIAGGGTAGHINPGIAIGKCIKAKHKDCEVVFVGTARGLENKLVPREGFPLKLIKVRGFKRKISKDTVVAVKEMFQGFFEARKLIREFKPDIVIGTGGYVCGPVVFYASRIGIPTLIHEQNAYPGVTIKILSKFVDRVAVSFEESKKYFKSDKKVVVTGNPIREDLLKADRKKARESFGISNEKFVVVMGGSLGAEKINEAVVNMVKNNYKNNEFKLIFATGNKNYDGVKEKLPSKLPEKIEVVPYIYDTPTTYAAADLCVCRAGAITTSELAALGMPSILIPSPYVTANHQEHNARAFEKNGAAVVMLEKDLTSEGLYQKINEILNDRNGLLKMREGLKKMAKVDSTNMIYDMAMDLLKTAKKSSSK